MLELKKALLLFLGDLDEIEGSAKLIADTYRVLGRSEKFFDPQFLGSCEQRTIESFRRGKDVNSLIFYQSSYVQICASFESFIRDLIERCVDQVSQNIKSFDDLHMEYRNRNIFFTGQAFQQIFENKSAMELDFFKLCKNIGRCQPGSAEFELNSRVFTLFVTDLGSGRLTDSLRRIGVKWNWDNAGRDVMLKKYFDNKRSRDAGKMAREYLNQFVNSRNHIVHKGDKMPSVTEGDVINAVTFFRYLSPVIYLEAVSALRRLNI